MDNKGVDNPDEVTGVILTNLLKLRQFIVFLKYLDFDW